MSTNFDDLLWVEADQNPFGVRCLDLRPYSWNVVSTTKDPQVALTFEQLRRFNGEALRGQSPDNHVTFPCQFHYSSRDRNFDESSYGAVMKATVMEDKWDIYLFDHWLYFTRSWDGQFCYRAKVTISSDDTVIEEIEAASQMAADGAEAVLAEVDFLIKSHLYGLPVPHRIPNSIAETDKQFITIWSFSCYGRRGAFASYEDTTLLQI